MEQVAPRGAVDLSGAPAGLDEATFDDLFPAEPRSLSTAPQAQPAAPAGTQSAPAAPAANQPTTAPSNAPSAPFIKGERSVYNSPEAAVAGINEKDALIESLRQRYALTTGIDPVTNKPVGQQQTQASPDYYNNPNQYLKDLYEAAQKSPEAYRDVQLKFFSDAFAPQLSALQPLIQQSAKDAAIAETAKEIPTIKDFVATPTYQKVLDQ